MNSPEALTILVADDHPLVRMGLAAMIERDPRFTLVGQAANGREAVEQYRALRPAITLMDLMMPDMGGCEAIGEIRFFDCDARIIILTTFDGDEHIYRGIRAGAKAYLLKDVSSEVMADCIIAVSNGRRYLTTTVAERLATRLESDQLSKREQEILRCLSIGKSNKTIARMVDISEGTVKYHVKNILAKLAVSSRTEAVTTAIRRGIVSVDLSVAGN